MQKIIGACLLLIVEPTFAKGVFETLGGHQKSLPAKSATDNSATVLPTAGAATSSSKKCEQDDQKSIPLSSLSNLILDNSGMLTITHDPRSGRLSISTDGFISNCSSMIKWESKPVKLDGKQSYAIEARIADGDKCGDSGCKYKVKKVKDGEILPSEEMTFQPTLRGFEECIKQSGVVSDGKVVPGAIFDAPLMETFPNVKETGKVLFVSNGPESSMAKAKYGKFVMVDGCNHYEKIHPEFESVISADDEKRMQLNQQAEELKKCSINEYHKLTDFINQYEEYDSILGEIRDNLIKQAAQKSATTIAEGKFTDEDAKVISDFDKYVVKPRLNKVESLYNAMTNAQGDEKKALQERIKAALADLASLNVKPYFLSSHVEKLLNDGQFDQAQKLNSVRLAVQHFSKVGQKEGPTLISPDIAVKRVNSDKTAFANYLVDKKEKYEIKTGQVTGNADYYAGLVRRMRNSMETRTRNYGYEIQSEQERMRPGGHCYKYYRNTQKCIQDSTDRINELYNYLQHYNKIDAERAAEYEAKANEYRALEAEGKRYLAGQNGEVVTESPAVTTDTTVVPPRGNQSYDFQNSSPQYYQHQNYQQQYPPTYQGPTNPYAQNNMFQQQQPFQYQQQNTWMGSQNYSNWGAPSQFGPQGAMNYQYPSQQSYSFQWMGGSPYNQGQQPYYGYGQQYGQQQGYWAQPNQAYGFRPF